MDENKSNAQPNLFKLKQMLSTPLNRRQYSAHGGTLIYVHEHCMLKK